MKVAVYTCITNSYDSVISPKIINPNIDYYCFNDGSIKVKQPWIDILINENLSPKDINRKLKLQPHLNEILNKYELTIYVDGSIEILSNLQNLIDIMYLTDGHTFLYNHNFRNCILEECIECYLSNKVSLISCRKMRKHLEIEGMSAGFGMFEAGVILRKSKSIDCIFLMDKWWDNYMNSFGVKRDQIALMYTLWKYKLNVNSLGLPDFHNGHQHFKLKTSHKNIFFKQVFNWWVRRPIRILLIYLNIIKIA
jgi:hypothetical protein